MNPEVITSRWTLVSILCVALFTNCIAASPEITTVIPSASKVPAPKVPPPKVPVPEVPTAPEAPAPNAPVPNAPVSELEAPAPKIASPEVQAPRAPSTEQQPADRFILDTASLDLNNDGCISGKTELDAFKQHVTSALEGTPNSVLRAHSIVYRTDVNRDGRICWCDFISIYLHDKTMRNKHSVPFLVVPDTVMFNQLDDDQDGQLAGNEKDKLEAEFASCLPPAQAKYIIDSMAGLLDRDESISREEFQQYFDTPGAGHHRPSPARLGAGGTHAGDA